jgi:hypothetical protein
MSNGIRIPLCLTRGIRRARALAGYTRRYIQRRWDRRTLLAREGYGGGGAGARGEASGRARRRGREEKSSEKPAFESSRSRVLCGAALLDASRFRGGQTDNRDGGKKEADATTETENI